MPDSTLRAACERLERYVRGELWQLDTDKFRHLLDDVIAAAKREARQETGDPF